MQNFSTMETNTFYTEIPPCNALQPYVECYWIVKNTSQTLDAHKDKVLPYGYPEVGFVYGDGFSFSVGEHAEERVPECFLAGQFCQPYFLCNKGKSGMTTIKFKPAGLYELLRVPMKEFTNKVVDFASIAGAEASLWANQVVEAPSNFQRVKLIENFLLNKLHLAQTGMAVMQLVVDLIINKFGNVTVKELACKLNISDRQLERRFLEVVGVSPKLFARMIRMNYVFKLLRSNPDLKWQDIIYLCGYYDQAHFIRDFKCFAGESPKVFMAKRFAGTREYQTTELV
jgi:AraC-like DNA-binding protein